MHHKQKQNQKPKKPKTKTHKMSVLNRNKVGFSQEFILNLRGILAHAQRCWDDVLADAGADEARDAGRKAREQNCGWEMLKYLFWS